MTNEEAKEFLINISYKLGNMSVEYLTEKDGEKMRKAIEALEQEPCEDCISREKLDKALYENFHEEDSPNNITDVRLGAVKNFIRNFPSINPQEPKLDTLNKVRAEIRDWQRDIHDNEYDAETHDFVFEGIYGIIDELKAESEVENDD